MTLHQFQKRTLNKETHDDLHSKKYKFMLLGKKKKKKKKKTSFRSQLVKFSFLASLPICLCPWFFSPSFELWITTYLGKFALSRIPPHHIITCFLAHCLGNFSIKSLNQISCLLSLNTFQDSRDNKCQSIKTVFSSLKIKLSSAAWFKMYRQIINSSLEGLLIQSKLKSSKWQKS